MRLEQLGWNSDWQQSFDAQRAALRESADRDLAPARVARQDRDGYVLYTHGRALRATLRGALRFRAVAAGHLPGVGDWVVVATRGAESRGVIEALLPRRSAVERKAVGDAATAQLIVANVDVVLICCGLDGDYNPRRIERYVALAYASGAEPAIVLTKADACDVTAERCAEVALLAIGAPVLAVGFGDEAGPQAVRALVGFGRTAALLGSSGVGKSTLINRLLQREAMAVREVREHDQRGRHTTTHRQLLLLPGGGVLIDTPGMRELALWADEDDVGAAFDDISELAGACRFRDCTHQREPGCAVRAALERGDLPADRLDSYHKLQRELRYLERREDPVARSAETARWKALHKAARRHMRDKYR